MNVALRRPMDVDEFLAWEREQELRYEFDGVQPIAMTGGTVAHSVIASNIYQALDARLQEPCRVFRSDLKILTQKRVRYPDVVVSCSDVGNEADVLPEPVALFEVLSESTKIVDLTVKADEYQATASVQHYVILEQDAAEATVLSRTEDGWVEARVIGLEGRIALPALGVEITMAEAYRRVIR